MRVLQPYEGLGRPMTADPLPSRTYECGEPCCQTYFAGKHSGPGPFFCAICGAELTLRPVGAEPYQGGAAVEPEPAIATLPLFAQEQS